MFFFGSNSETDQIIMRSTMHNIDVGANFKVLMMKKSLECDIANSESIKECRLSAHCIIMMKSNPPAPSYFPSHSTGLYSSIHVQHFKLDRGWNLKRVMSSSLSISACLPARTGQRPRGGWTRLWQHSGPEQVRENMRKEWIHTGFYVLWLCTIRAHYKV